MKQVLPRFCNPVRPKVPASPELPREALELLLKKLEDVFPAEPFIASEVPLGC